jgi:arabinofuranosyltransferase
MALAAGLVALFHRVQADDAYVTFRYGQNLALGRGFVFNPGERVMGSTSPGQTLVAWLVYLVVGKGAMPSVMTALGVVAWVTQAIVLRALVRSERGEVAGWAMALFTAVALGGQAAYVSMETNTVVALNLLGLLLASRGRLRSAAVVFAIATTFRPDGLLFPLALLLVSWRKQGRALVVPLVLYLVLAAVWPLFAWSYFGTPFPHTLQAKAGAVPLLDYLWHALRFASTTLLPIELLGGGVVHVLVVWPMLVFGGVQLWRGGGWLRVFPIHALVHFAAYVVLRPFVEHSWHLVPAVVSASVCLVAAGHALAQRVPESSRRLASGTALAALLLLGGFRLAEVRQQVDTGYWIAGRFAVYDELMRELERRARPEETLGTLEIGYIAYWSDRRVFDLGGLINPFPQPVLENGVAKLDERDFDWLVLDGSAPRPYAPSSEPVATFQHHGFAAALFKSRASR